MNEVMIALDIGGTTIKGALVDRTRTVHDTLRQPTGPHRGPDAVLATITGTARQLAHRARSNALTPTAVGLAAPGIVHETEGVAVWSANLGLRSVPLRDHVATRLDLPTVLGHDVRAGALAEARLGAGRRVPRMWFVAIGTGIAAAHVIDGHTDRGAHGTAGELGHIVVCPDGPPCGCGNRGCLESIASASAVARRYEQRTGVHATGHQVAMLAATGEDAARTIWNEAVDALADALRIGITLHDPDMIVLGGGMALAGPILFAPLTDALRHRMTLPTMPAILPAALGDQAGCRGAAELALDLIATPQPGNDDA